MRLGSAVAVRHRIGWLLRGDALASPSTTKSPIAIPTATPSSTPIPSPRRCLRSVATQHEGRARGCHGHVSAVDWQGLIAGGGNLTDMSTRTSTPRPNSTTATGQFTATGSMTSFAPTPQPLFSERKRPDRRGQGCSGPKRCTNASALLPRLGEVYTPYRHLHQDRIDGGSRGTTLQPPFCPTARSCSMAAFSGLSCMTRVPASSRPRWTEGRVCQWLQRATLLLSGKVPGNPRRLGRLRSAGQG